MKRNPLLPIVACVASLALCPALRAQDGSPAPAASPGAWQSGGHHGGDMLQHLTEHLSLTSDQQAKIKPILDSLHQQMMTIHQDSTLDRPAKMAKIKAAREDAGTQIKAVLTDDQQTKFTAMWEHMGSHHRGGQGGPEASPSTSP